MSPYKYYSGGSVPSQTKTQTKNSNKMKTTERVTEIYQDIAGEEWRPLPNSTYQVSNRGRVMNRFGKVLKPQVMQVSAYMQYSAYGIRLEGETKTTMRYSHHLVAQVFMGDRPDKFEINHINLDSRDNRLENLEYVSSRDNQLHSNYMKGRRSTNLVIAYESGEYKTKIRRPDHPEISVGTFPTQALAKGAINIWCAMTGVPIKEWYYFSYDDMPKLRRGRPKKQPNLN
jgi:hypothetical protein